jgi:hypothetical protein
MSKRLMIISAGLLAILSCNQNHTCIGIKDGKYGGYGLIFYHMPVSGSSNELVIVPTCNDSSDLISEIINGTKLNNRIGVSVNMNSRNTFFEGIYKNSVKLRLFNNDSLAPQYRVVYICPVYIQFENADNATEIITWGRDSILSEKLIFKNNREASLKYFLSTKIRITELRVL